MDMWISGFTWGVLIGVLALLKIQKIIDRREMPYRYVCPLKDCAFEIKATDMSTVDMWATTHERTHNG